MGILSFKTEVPKCNSPVPRFCSASNVFCFDYSLHLIIWTENLGIPCGCLLSSSPSTSKHWPLLVSFCSHFYNPYPRVGGNNCLYVLVDWLTAYLISPLCSLVHKLWADLFMLCLQSWTNINGILPVSQWIKASLDTDGCHMICTPSQLLWRTKWSASPLFSGLHPSWC